MYYKLDRLTTQYLPLPPVVWGACVWRSLAEDLGSSNNITGPRAINQGARAQNWRSNAPKFFSQRILDHDKD